jgi:hypothetical protein
MKGTINLKDTVYDIVKANPEVADIMKELGFIDDLASAHS